MKSLDVLGFLQHVRTLHRSYSRPSHAILRSAVWGFGLRPLVGAAFDKVAPDWWRDIRKRRIVRQIPSWIAPDPALRTEFDSRLGRCLAEANPPSGFYRREMRSAIDHTLTSMELEEHFELGGRVGARMLHPYWDVDLVELLMPRRQRA